MCSSSTDPSSAIRPVTSAAPEAATVLGELEATNRLLAQQVFKPVTNQYGISIPAPGSTEEGRPLPYVKQKKMKVTRCKTDSPAQPQAAASP